MAAESKVRRSKRAERVAVQDARQDFKDHLNRVEFHGERIVITRYGQDAAALVPLADLQRLEGAA